ncbi:MAG: bifunctional 5,10-methylenetetrahydrofolate dehydrogenase/5,10-methenyltetrahydrofolate cyclohydrolase [Defluviitaleaceae bacterium]|nr:bifunctional 5,10-methylenetetrahydrofolate dehydrogenase/5,10-methenyltetrahydrofolate cyclohydrolase [Defluviitaleaceae bacterium]
MEKGIDNSPNLEGKYIARKIKDSLAGKFENVFVAIVSVGDDFSASSYTRSLLKNFDEFKINYAIYNLNANVSQKDFNFLIETLDNTDFIKAIFLHRPLNIDTKASIEPLKEPFFSKDLDSPPCTAAAVIQLLKGHNIDLKSKNCLIIGRSEVVGKPLAKLFLNENATVTIAHSYTKNLKSLTMAADIIVSAVGKPNFLNGDMVSAGAVVVDVGINYLNGKLVGDCDYNSIYEKTLYITPVPGGVGPITSAMVLVNLARLANL